MRPPLSTILAARSACAALAIAVMLAWATAGSAQAAPAVAAGGPLRVLPGSGSTFPSRSLVLMVPGRRPLAPSPVSVLENGRPVGPTVVTSIGAAGANDFGVVLAIDVSPSMSGASLEHATQAARTLA